MDKPLAFGTVVMADDGRILLREPANHYGGAVWTFPKGRPDPEEEPEDTALRETREETGIHAEIVARLPGEFEGTVTNTVFFLARPTERYSIPGNETWSLRWTAPDEAEHLIRQTPERKVRDRDLEVLAAALDEWNAGTAR